MRIDRSAVLVVGGGAAATRAAIEAARCGAATTMVVKGGFARSGTSPLGLHGFASTLDPRDSERTLVGDIVRGGGYINDVDLVRTAVHESRTEPARLEAMGVRFVRHPDGAYDIYRGAGHSVPHGLTFDERENGENLIAVLGNEAWKRGVHLVENVMIVELVLDGTRVLGALGIDANGEEVLYAAPAVVLGAGGANRAFPNPVPRIAAPMYRTTGDGLALALRAGLPLVDMEMANFRDTPPAARIGRYRNVKGEYFMERYHPMRENAPRGTVVEALYREMRAGNGPISIEVSDIGQRDVYMMPQEYQDYVKAYNEGKAPAVAITFQRLLGGVRIADDASTRLPGIYAAGENAGGFHGGDRVQGAAFLETQVFGRFAGTNAAAYARMRPLDLDDRGLTAFASGPREHLPMFFADAGDRRAADLIAEIQRLDWEYASIVKSAQGLSAALEQLGAIRAQLARGVRGTTAFEPFEAANLALTAESIVRASLARAETRAAHRRSDYPDADPHVMRMHTSVTMRGNGDLVCELVPARGSVDDLLPAPTAAA